MTSASKNVYINKLDGIVNKCNNTRHSTIKMNSIDVKAKTYIDSSKKIYDKDFNLKLMINIKIFLQKVAFQIGLRKFLGLKKLKILCLY